MTMNHFTISKNGTVIYKKLAKSNITIKANIINRIQSIFEPKGLFSPSSLLVILNA